MFRYLALVALMQVPLPLPGGVGVPVADPSPFQRASWRAPVPPTFDCLTTADGLKCQHATPSATGTPSIGVAPVKPGKAVTLSAASYSLGVVGAAAGKDLNVCASFKGTSSAAAQAIITTLTTAVRGWALNFVGPTLKVTFYTSGGAGLAGYDLGAVNLGDWNVLCVAFTASTGIARGNLNGVPVAPSPAMPAIEDAAAGLTWIGTDTWSETMLGGSVAHVAVWIGQPAFDDPTLAVAVASQR